MLDTNGVLIRVHGSWSGWRSAEVHLADLEDVHWRQPPGAPHALIHARVWCTRRWTGDLPHDCDRRSAPHRLLVCVLKRHTTATIYAELARLADQRHAGHAAAPPAMAGALEEEA